MGTLFRVVLLRSVLSLLTPSLERNTLAFALNPAIIHSPSLDCSYPLSPFARVSQFSAADLPSLFTLLIHPYPAPRIHTYALTSAFNVASLEIRAARGLTSPLNLVHAVTAAMPLSTKLSLRSVPDHSANAEVMSNTSLPRLAASCIFSLLPSSRRPSRHSLSCISLCSRPSNSPFLCHRKITLPLVNSDTIIERRTRASWPRASLTSNNDPPFFDLICTNTLGRCNTVPVSRLRWKP